MEGQQTFVVNKSPDERGELKGRTWSLEQCKQMCKVWGSVKGGVGGKKDGRWKMKNSLGMEARRLESRGPHGSHSGDERDDVDSLRLSHHAHHFGANVCDQQAYWQPVMCPR